MTLNNILMPRQFRWFTFMAAIVLISSCTDFQKALKSDDYELKYTKAKEYYQEEDYSRALTLLESIRPVYRGTQEAPRIDYLIANSYFKQKTYILAGYHFRNLAETFPNSEYTEEAEYKSAYCYYLESPRPSLDQSSTHKAIEAFQMYIRKYPQSDKIDQCNGFIDELRGKLEEKAFDAAMFYFNLGDYRAAAIALESALNQYPDTEFRKELLFHILKAKYLLASNSVQSKKEMRLEETIEAYYPFVDEFPESEEVEEAKEIFSDTQEQLSELRKNTTQADNF